MIQNFTYNKSNEKELEGNQVLPGLSGFDKETGLDVLHEWSYFCSIKECVTSIHWIEPVPIISNGKQYILHGHRHNQSILSILRIRHNLVTVQKIWNFDQFRSLDHANQNNSLIYNHHGSYEDIQIKKIIMCYHTKDTMFHLNNIIKKIIMCYN